jgi:2-polyprenyl-3-methyl-5-hydroxy-6-metoxy-1,4-benzoquinol methylase
MGLAKTNLEIIDFAKLYTEQMKNSTFKGKTSQDWDKKAKSFNENIKDSSYTKEFLYKINIVDAKTLLDVGCGPGTISLELAPKFKHIYAMDYSRGMLECLENNCDMRNINNITTVHKSWEDDWSDLPQFDIVVASRSLEVMDVKKAIEKLNSKAKKRVYVTFKVGGSFIDEEILAQLKRYITPRPDYIYLVNILHSMGICAKIDFIKSENKRFLSESGDEFLEKVKWSLGDLSKEESKILKEYFEKTYKYKKETGFIKWALLSWEVSENKYPYNEN